MKNSIILSFVALLLCQCDKQEVLIFEPGSMEFGNTNAQKSGHGWKASVYSEIYDEPYNSYFFMHFNTFLGGNYLRESLIIGKIPAIKGKYKIIKDSNSTVYGNEATLSYSVLEDDGDVLGDSYDVDEDANNNEVEVTYIDTIADIVQGKFSVTLVIKEPKTNPLNADCVEFTHGEFEATFQ